MVRALIAAWLLLSLVGCGKTMEGEYVAEDESSKLTLSAGKKAYFDFGTANLVGTYSVDGDNVVVQCPAASPQCPTGSILMKIQPDGTLQQGGGGAFIQAEKYFASYSDARLRNMVLNTVKRCEPVTFILQEIMRVENFSKIAELESDNPAVHKFQVGFDLAFLRGYFEAELMAKGREFQTPTTREAQNVCVEMMKSANLDVLEKAFRKASGGQVEDIRKGTVVHLEPVMVVNKRDNSWTFQ